MISDNSQENFLFPTSEKSRYRIRTNKGLPISAVYLYIFLNSEALKSLISYYNRI